jgi:hypothetical protein
VNGFRKITASSANAIRLAKHVEQILSSILEEYERGGKNSDELEAKSLFLLLNYRPPPDSSLLEEPVRRH